MFETLCILNILKILRHKKCEVQKNDFDQNSVYLFTSKFENVG